MFSFFKKSKKEEVALEYVQIPKIEYTQGTKFATNNENDLYLDFEELGGFPYIKLMIIGTLYTRIKNEGAQLNFEFENELITLNSEHVEIESNEIKNTPFCSTEIDFEVTEQEIEKIKNIPVQKLSLNLKGEISVFNIIPIEIETETLNDSENENEIEDKNISES